MNAGSGEFWFNNVCVSTVHTRQASKDPVMLSGEEGWPILLGWLLVSRVPLNKCWIGEVIDLKARTEQSKAHVGRGKQTTGRLLFSPDGVMPINHYTRSALHTRQTSISGCLTKDKRC
jgi:hypothetical protein